MIRPAPPPLTAPPPRDFSANAALAADKVVEAGKHSAHTEPRVRVSPLRNPRADIWIKEAASDRTERRFTERGGNGCRAAPEAGSVFDRPLEKCYLICSHDGPRWGLHHAASLPSFLFSFPRVSCWQGGEKNKKTSCGCWFAVCYFFLFFLKDMI